MNKSLILLFLFLVPLVSATYCYQESANVSTACGGLNTGNYNWTDKELMSNPNNIYDGSWITSATMSNVHPYAEQKINYTKPTGTTSALWQIAVRGNLFVDVYRNISVPSNCLLTNNLMLDWYYNYGGSTFYFTCYNGTSFQLLDSIWSFERDFWEEAMWWDIVSYNASSINLNFCNGSNYPIVQYNLSDEVTRQPIISSNYSIEVSLNITDNTTTYQYSTIVHNESISICGDNTTIQNGNFTLNSVVKYSTNDHVVRYNYITNYALSNLTANKSVILYDLNNTLSSSFLITYQDMSYNYVPNVIINSQRNYVDLNNSYLSVEHALTDANGQTRLHFETEDVIYKLYVYDMDNNLLYTTGDMYAICLSSPCTVALRQPYNDSSTTSQSEGLTFDISSDSDVQSTNTIIFNFLKTDGMPTNITMAVTRTTWNRTLSICNSSIYSSAGSVSCDLSASMLNTSYTAYVYKEGILLGSREYTVRPISGLGDTGIFLGALAYLMMVLMALSSPIIAVVFGLVGLMMISAMSLINGGSFIGVGSTILYILISGGILIYKLADRRLT